jgi:hypothetical protein
MYLYFRYRDSPAIPEIPAPAKRDSSQPDICFILYQVEKSSIRVYLFLTSVFIRDEKGSFCGYFNDVGLGLLSRLTR